MFKLINPNRLQFARVRRGMTQTALADLLSVSARTVRAYEKGEFQPEHIELLSQALEFPVSFFYGNDLPTISDHAISFRSMSKMSDKLKDITVSSAIIAFQLNEWLESEFDLPEPNVPDLSDLDPESAALTLRRHWGLGEAPIPNMIALLEKNGIRVFSLTIESNDVDAFCTWNNNTPFIFLNTLKSAERSRFDAAHELAHLVRDLYSMKHSIEKDNPKEIEKKANDFASAFLMPKAYMITSKPKFVTTDGLIVQKKFWGVSVAALAYRMYKLGLVSEWIYSRHLCIDISKKGYRVNEPNPMPREQSALLKKILLLLREENISVSDIATKIMVHPRDIQNLLFGLDKAPLIPLIGGKSSWVTESSGIKSNHLTLVK